jgi:Histidine kinase-, DNA gyrase B-, and HSP90-like ATPase
MKRTKRQDENEQSSRPAARTPERAQEKIMNAKKKDATKQSGSSPTKTAKQPTAAKLQRNQDSMTGTQTATSWLEIDIIGLRRTLERKGKAWAIFELVQNAWDTDATRVDVTLTKPNKNGRSTLTCRDNAPDGYRDLSEAHTLFGSSSKKSDPTKRGRFNAGEKFVLVMCESAKVTSTTGQIAGIIQPQVFAKMIQQSRRRTEQNVGVIAGVMAA